MEAELGPARHEEASDLARLSRVSFPDPWSASVFQRELQRPETRAWVARGPKGRRVAFVLGWRVLDEIQVLSVAVAPTWRRRGLASELLGAYLDALRSEGVREATLEVRASNRPAQALYGRLGFETAGQRPRYYRGGETALLLEAQL
jgi:ribosomal-protein-alanine N-acetyltransferase